MLLNDTLLIFKGKNNMKKNTPLIALSIVLLFFVVSCDVIDSLTTEDTTQAAPTNLTSTVSGTDIAFSWTNPTTFDQVQLLYSTHNIITTLSDGTAFSQLAKPLFLSNNI